jgi:glycerophosphoryl diester phosphodiesterase
MRILTVPRQVERGDGAPTTAPVGGRTLIGFAHRGSPAWYQRENTLPAFQRALTAGVSGLESDVWLTADGVPVLHHDGVLGSPGRRRTIPTLAASQLPGWLPTLPAAYAALGTSYQLSLDLKGPAGSGRRAAATVVAVARAAGGDAAVRRLWLCGRLSELWAWRDLDDRVRLVNSTSVRDVLAAGGIAAYVRLLRSAGVDALNLPASEWTPARAPVAGVLHDHGLLVFGWDVQRRSALSRLTRYGLDGLYSDHLGRLVDVTSAANRSAPP